MQGCCALLAPEKTGMRARVLSRAATATPPLLRASLPLRPSAPPLPRSRLCGGARGLAAAREVKNSHEEVKLDRWGNPLVASDRTFSSGGDRVARATVAAAKKAVEEPVSAETVVPAAAPKPTAPPPNPAPVAAATKAHGDTTAELDVLNTGSTARDHLANERTFLAWARTGVGFVAMGVAVDTLMVKRGEEQPPAVDRSTPPPAALARARARGGDGAEKAVGGAWTSQRPHDKKGMLAKVSPPVMLVGVGGMFLTYATWRYYQVQQALLRGQFPVNRVGVGAVVASSSLLTLAGLAMVRSESGRNGALPALGASPSAPSS